MQSGTQASPQLIQPGPELIELKLVLLLEFALPALKHDGAVGLLVLDFNRAAGRKPRKENRA